MAIDNSEASQVLKKILKVDRTDTSVSVSSNISSNNGNSHNFDLSGDDMNAVGQSSVNGGSDSFFQDLRRSFQQPSRIKQQILLQGSDTKNSHVVYGQDVEIMASRASSVNQPSSTGSSKVKINPVVKFDWENKCYVGSLVAVHLNRTHVAYVLRGKAGGNVRVYNRKTAERALLKGFVGKIVDISFAFTSSVVLGIVDEVGGVYIYDITELQDGKLSTSLRLQCHRPAETPASDYHRLVWCTYVPDSVDAVGTSDDASMLLLVTHDNIAEIWNVDEASQSQTVHMIAVSDQSVGRTIIKEHVQPIVDGVFSPDGLHMATAGLDGFVKFYELGREEQTEPRCEHNWQPHGGRPVSCIIFLDNLKDQNADTFWSFVITGAVNNHELKIWSSQNWSCLQTITLIQPLEVNSHFDSSPVVDPKPYIKAKLDLSASYIVLSDISRKVLYVLQLHQDHEANTAHVSSLSEFLLSQPVLSFALLDAGRRRLGKTEEFSDEHVWSCTTEEEYERIVLERGLIGSKSQYGSGDLRETLSYVTHVKDENSTKTSQDYLKNLSETIKMTFGKFKLRAGEVGHDDDETEVPADDQGPDIGVLVRLYAIQTKAMQELQIRYQPESSVGMLLPSSCSSTSDTGTGMHDPLSDLSIYSDFERNGGSHLSGSPGHRLSSTSSSGHHADFSFSASHAPAQPLLLTPEAFSSTRVSDETCDTQGSVSSSLTLVTAIDEDLGQIIDLGVSRATGGLPDFGMGSTDPKSLLPAEPLDLFPGARSGRLSREQSPDQKLLIDLGNACNGGIERSARNELSQSESSESTGGASAELTEILESARQSDGLDVHLQCASEGAYNDDDMGSGEEEEEEEGDGQDDEMLQCSDRNADGICHFVKPEWRSVSAEEETSPYSDQPRVENKQMRCIDDVHATRVHDSSETQGRHPVLLMSAERRTSDHEQAGVNQLVIEDMQRSLKHMLQMMQQQQQEIAQLNSCLGRQSQLSNAVDRLSSQVETMESTILSSITDHLRQQSRSDSDGWRRALSELETRSRELQGNLETSCAHSVDETVRTQLEAVVRTEVNNAVIPRIVEILNPIKDQFHTELAQKLTATDSLLKDSISKLVRSKQTMEALSQAIASSMQSSVTSVSRDVLLPSFDRACQNMFQQLRQHFSEGHRIASTPLVDSENMQQMESQIQQVQRRRDETRDPVLNQLKAVMETMQRREQAQEPVHERLTGAVEALKLTNAQMASNTGELETKLLKKINGLHETLVAQLKQIVQQEVSTAVRQHQTALTDRLEQALRSGAATPVPVDYRADGQQMQQQIALLLRHGKTNQAFQQALSATDLSLVVYVCGAVDPEVLFTDECPLSQPVLLSLIQQLSVHFESDIELKHRYLQDAVMKLDPSNPVTREHSVAVVTKVISRLSSYLQTANSKDTMYAEMKRLRTMYEFVLRGFNQL